jgi:hypothetical protein
LSCLPSRVQQSVSNVGSYIQLYLFKSYIAIMITHYDFLLMTETEQYNAVWSGTFLGDRKGSDGWVQLYNVSNFYVEVFYDSTFNEIKRIRSFTKVGQLDPYL